MLVRPARPGEAEILRTLEVAAGGLFHDIGMTVVAEDEPPTIGELELAIAEGRIWIAEIVEDEPAGYALGVVVDGHPHLEQVSVDPAQQRRGVGRALVNVVADWAVAQGASVLTLTTFRDVAWNAPLYERLSFVVVPDEQLSPGLRSVRDREIAAGLDDAGPRVAMQRQL